MNIDFGTICHALDKGSDGVLSFRFQAPFKFQIGFIKFEFLSSIRFTIPLQMAIDRLHGIVKSFANHAGLLKLFKSCAETKVMRAKILDHIEEVKNVE
jgi:hypothetical protein